MSQGFHQGIYSFSNHGLDRSSTTIQQDQQHNINHELPGYETGGGMLSEMFNFPSSEATPVAASTTTSDHILESQVSANYRLLRPSTAAMQLFLMNPPQQRSPSPPPPPPSLLPPHQISSSSSTTPHLLLHPSTPPPLLHGGFHPSSQFTWVSSNINGSGGDNNNNSTTTSTSKIGGTLEMNHHHQGLSLSLSSLQHLEAAKADQELRMGDGGLFYYNQAAVCHDQLENLGNQHHHHHHHHQHQPPLRLQALSHQNVGFNASHQFGVVNVLRNSKYKKAAQALLEDFCSVGRGHLKNHRSFGRNKTNPSSNINTTKVMGDGGSSSSSKDPPPPPPPPLSSADRVEYQRRKVTLLTMLDEACIY